MLSIDSGATTVPKFASEHEKLTSTERINSWLHFTEVMRDKGDDSTGIDSNKVFKFNAADKLYLSLRTYFENGGGYCYLIPISKLEAEVPKLDDVMLLVEAGESGSQIHNYEVVQ